MRSYGLDVGHEVMGANGTSDWYYIGKSFKWNFDHLLHVVRNPWDTIESMYLTTAPENREFQWQCCMDMFGVTDMEDSLERAAYAFVLWHQLIDEKDISLTYRIEDADQAIPNWLANNGIDCSRQDSSMLNYNAREHRKIKACEWLAIPTKTLDMVREFADRYGYDFN